MTNKNLNFVFFGTPDVASNTLEILKENGLTPSLIVTSIDKPQGRKMTLTPSPTKVWATENNIPFIQPEKITDEVIKKISEQNADLFIVVAYGKILPEKLINIPLHGTINIHYSLLPKYRGASPLESALLNGDASTGVAIQRMVYELDSGPIIGMKEIHIEESDTKTTLRTKLIKLGAYLLLDILPSYLEGKITPEPQQGEATFSTKIKKEHGEIDIDGNPKENWNKYRAYFGWPGIFFWENGKRIKITEASYENNSFSIKRVVSEGKKEISYEDFLKQK